MWFEFGLKVFYSTQGSVRRDESTWDGPCPNSSYGSLIPMVDYHTLPRRIIQKSMNKYRFWISFVPQARSFFTLNQKSDLGSGQHFGVNFGSSKVKRGQIYTWQPWYDVPKWPMKLNLHQLHNTSKHIGVNMRQDFDVGQNVFDDVVLVL